MITESKLYQETQGHRELKFVTEPSARPIIESVQRVAVTGASGFIGSGLTQGLIQAGAEVVALSRSRPRNVHRNVRWIQWSSEDEWPMSALEAVDTIYHLAARTNSYEARQSPLSSMDVNALGVMRIIESLRANEVRPRVITVGAITELEPNAKGIVTDESQIAPRTFYDVGKVTQRLLLNQCVLEGWVDAVSILLPNVYGYWTDSQGPNRGFLNNSIRTAFQGSDLTYYTDADYIRDFLYIDDAVDALIKVGNLPGLRRTSYVIGTGQGVPIKTALHLVSEEVRKKTGLAVQVVGVEPPTHLYSIEKRNTTVSCTPFRHDTRWSPGYSLSDGIQAVLEKYLLNAGR